MKQASLNRRAFGWRGAGVETSDHRGTDLIVCWKSRATSSAESRISLESRRVIAVHGSPGTVVVSNYQLTSRGTNHQDARRESESGKFIYRRKQLAG